jgi:DNA-binding SARP family transcriptional activator
MTAVRLLVSGGLRLVRDGVEADLGPTRQRVVLAVLVAARGSAVPVSALVDAAWGDDPPASAVNQLHRAIGQLRRLFEPDLARREVGRYILPAGAGYRLEADARTSDLVAFDQLSVQARAEGSAELYDRALALVEEPVFAGLPGFVTWQQRRLAAAAEAAALPGAERYLGRIESIAAGARLYEPLQAGVIRLLVAAGRRAEALVLYDEVRQSLAEEVGAEPGADLMAAFQLALREETRLLPRFDGFVPRDDVVLDDDPAGGVVVLSGMGGAGKTVLATQWARRLAGRFPDGQLYVNLRGFHPGGRELSPLAAVTTLLESLGADLTRVGPSLEARTAEFRALLAGRRTIVVLDNARDSEHVYPLLPEAAGGLTIVTSRSRLSGLVVHRGARPVPVGPFAEPEALALLTNRLGAARIAAEPEAAGRLISLCGGLPLALAVASARIALTPALTLADVVRELSARPGLSALNAGEEGADVRSALSWSYAVLSEAAQRVFRLLAAHPAQVMSEESLGSLAGLDPAAERVVLAELSAASMLSDLGGGLHSAHDLLVAYAEDLLTDEAERHDAEFRLVGHYVHSAFHAYRAAGLAAPAEPGPPPEGVSPARPGTVNEAIAWYERERPAVVAVIDLALERAWRREAVLITLYLRGVRSPYGEPFAESREQTLRVATASQDTLGPDLLVPLLRETGLAHQLVDPPTARHFFLRSLELAEHEGDLIGQAHALRNLGGDPPVVEPAEKEGYLRRAVAIARRVGEPSVLVFALDFLARHLEENVGDRTEAAGLTEEAFEIARRERLESPLRFISLRRAGLTADRGEHEAAIAAAQQTLALLPPDDPFHLPVRSILARARAGAGDLAGARHEVEVFEGLLRDDEKHYIDLFGPEEVGSFRNDVAGAVAAIEAASTPPS